MILIGRKTSFTVRVIKCSSFAHGSRAVTTLGDVWSLSGHGHEPPALIDPAGVGNAGFGDLQRFLPALSILCDLP